MGAQPSTLDKELSCPVCFNIFKDPVSLHCNHNFCQECLMAWWREKATRDCPVCRRRSSVEYPDVNCSLRNIVESHLKTNKIQNPSSDTERLCLLHREEKKLYCLQDEETICVVCQTSKRHRNHSVCPAQEKAEELKENLKIALNPLQEQLKRFHQAKEERMKTADYIKSQATQTEQKIKEDFKKLHQFLEEEEATRLAVLREEEEKKSQRMKEKIETLMEEITALSDTIGAIEQEMTADDISFIQVESTKRRYENSVVCCSENTRPAALTREYRCRARCTQPDPEGVPGVLIDVAEHLSSLKYRVWEKMLGLVQYYPMTLDPNTACSALALTDDLTGVTLRQATQEVPDNPERFWPGASVLGSQGFTAGMHCWEVEVGDNKDWAIGVAKEMVNRKGNISVDQAGGYWAISLQKGYKYSACSQPWTRLRLKRKPQRVRVQLDYDQGEVTFSDPRDMTPIYTFRDTFTERLVPFVSVLLKDKGGSFEQLRLCPENVVIAKNSTQLLSWGADTPLP
ncbi:A33 protein, partial [Amia calva]|nr:A33 protein [Amia calva]